MRHWHVIDSHGNSSFVMTGDFEHPRDVGYPDDSGFSVVRMAQEPGAFSVVAEGVITLDSQALRDAQALPLPQTQAALETLINARINALTSQSQPNA